MSVAQRRCDASRCSSGCRSCCSPRGGSPAPAAPTSTARRCRRSSTAFARDLDGDRILRRRCCPSLGRLAVGYALALVVGVGARRADRQQPRRAGVPEPLLEFLRAIPPPVLVPVLMLFAGIGDRMKVLVIVFGCVWPILLNTVEGVRGRRRGAQRHLPHATASAASLRLWHLVLRSASPQIVTGARQALSIAHHPDGDQRDVRREQRPRLHRPAVPARLPDPRDVERRAPARPHRRRAGAAASGSPSAGSSAGTTASGAGRRER